LSRPLCPPADGSGRSPRARAQVQPIAFDETYLPTTGLNGQVIGIPADPSGKVVLETTVYKPDGPGPFPMIVFNHGKIKGDPHRQAPANRSRSRVYSSGAVTWS
jgi:hypothetical protein